MSSYWSTHQNRVDHVCDSVRNEVISDHNSEYSDGESPRYLMNEKPTRCGQTSYLLNGRLDNYQDEIIYSDNNRTSIDTIITIFKEKLLYYGMLIISIETIGINSGRHIDHIFTLYQDYDSVKIVDSYIKFWLPRIRDMNWVDFEDKLGEIINIIQNEPNGNGPDGDWSHRKKYMMVHTIWSRLWGLPVYKDTIHWFPIKDLQIKFWYPNS